MGDKIGDAIKNEQFSIGNLIPELFRNYTNIKQISEENSFLKQQDYSKINHLTDFVGSISELQKGEIYVSQTSGDQYKLVILEEINYITQECVFSGEKKKFPQFILFKQKNIVKPQENVNEKYVL